MVEGFLSMDEKEKKRKKKIEQAADKEQQRRQEVSSYLSKNKIGLKELQELVKEGVVVINDKQLLERIARDEKLDDHELDDLLQDVQINDIIRKIEEIEKTMDIDKILPKELRVSPQDFKLACKDPMKRKEVVQKLDDGIDYIVPQISPSFKS